jgi:hypothetical protein
VLGIVEDVRQLLAGDRSCDRAIHGGYWLSSGVNRLFA